MYVLFEINSPSVQDFFHNIENSHVLEYAIVLTLFMKVGHRLQRDTVMMRIFGTGVVPGFHVADEIAIGDDAVEIALVFTIPSALDHRRFAKMGQQIEFAERGDEIQRNMKWLAQPFAGVESQQLDLLSCNVQLEQRFPGHMSAASECVTTLARGA